MNAILQELSYTQEEADEARAQYMRPEIQAQKEEFLHLYDNYNTILVTGQTGCGKSSYIPIFISEAHKNQRILICQPRRISVTGQCKRLSQIGNYKITREIGYMMGDEYFAYPINKIVVATSGCAFNYIINNPGQYDTIILDEIHEMNEQTQQVMSILLKIQPIYNFKIILMSATADCQLINKTFQNIAHFELEGTQQQQEYYVQVEEASEEFTYQNKIFKLPKVPDSLDVKQIIEVAAMQTIKIVLTMDSIKGDILVFLPGIKEMEQFKAFFIKKANQFKINQDNYDLMYFHATFSSTYKKQFNNLTFNDDNTIQNEEQTEQSLQTESSIKISQQTQNHTYRRIILGTTVCETSLTIPTLSFVIDTCMEKHKINNQLQLCLTTKNSMLQRKGRVGRCMNGLYIYCLKTSKVETLPQQFKPDPDINMILPLVYNDTLYNFDLIKNLKQLNGNVQDKIVEKTINILIDNNCIGKDINNQYRSTYYGFKVVRQIQEFNVQYQLYLQQFYNHQIGALMSQINSSNNKKIFIDNLEDDTHDKIPKEYILLASQLGYNDFIKAINLFQDNQKQLKSNLQKLAFLIKQFGSQILLNCQNEKAQQTMLLLYWRKRFPLPTNIPTKEEEQWCKLLGLSPSGLRSVELSYVQYQQITENQQLSLIEQQLSKQYFLISNEELDEQLQQLENMEQGQQYEQLHQQIWQQFLNKYSDGIEPSLARLCDQYNDTDKISDITKLLTIVNGLIQYNGQLLLKVKPQQSQQSVDQVFMEELMYYGQITNGKQNLIKTKEFEKYIKQITFQDIHIQQLKDGICVCQNNPQDQLAVDILLQNNANKANMLKYNNKTYYLPENKVSQLFSYVQYGQFKSYKQFYIPNNIVYKVTNIERDKQQISISSNGIACFLLSLTLNLQLVSIQFKFSDEKQQINNLIAFSIRNNLQTVFTYNFENVQQWTILDQAMISYLQVLVLLNFTIENQIKDDIARNELKIVEDCDDILYNQLNKCKFLLQYAATSDECKTYRSRLQKVSNDQKVQEMILIVFEIFNQIDFTYKQYKYFNMKKYQELQADLEYQFNYNPLIYKELQNE